MADATDFEPASTPNLPRVRDPQFREVYANVSLTGISPFDITLTFGKATDMAGQTVQVDQVAVTMSPQHFKALCLSLNETLKAYEEGFGELRIPEIDTKPLRDAAQIGLLIGEAREKRLALEKSLASSPSSTEQKPPAKRSRGARKK
jgi:hypothetical protein